MLQTVGDTRQGFLCPQCHQDMSNMEMLQVHFQNVHMKQPAAAKGFFSFAKQKIKIVQDNFKTTNDPFKPYAQYFSFQQNDNYSKQQHIGYSRSHNDRFNRIRRDKLDQIFNLTKKVLLRVELLTITNSHIPRNGNSKERRKYEQDIVRWMEDSVASSCSSCSKPFGLSRRKHHCRLDGLVICNQCSLFISFSIAQYLINPTNVPPSSAISGIVDRRLSNLTSITSAAIANDGSNEDFLRICLSCGQLLQKRYNQIRFNIMEKDEMFHHYEKIIEIRKEFDSIHPTYSTIIDSLLSGDTKYQIIDAQRLYRQLSACSEKIDSKSKLIAKLTDSLSNIHENDKTRYSTLCRNIRMYSIQLLQTCAISTRRAPSEEDVKQARDAKQRLYDEKNDGWKPTVDRSLLDITEEFEPMFQQHYQVTQFIRQAEKAGRYDEVKLLEINLKELEEAMSTIKQS